jgi:uncharacterized protein YrrD
MTSATTGFHGTVAIGAAVHATDKKVGEISRVVVDVNNDAISHLVVKSGVVFARERMVPIDAVDHGDRSDVYLSVDSDGFEEMEGFDPEIYRSADPDYVGPPGFDRDPDFQLDMLVAAGSTSLGATVPPLGFPGGEPIGDTHVAARPVIKPGDDVLDSNGEKVGEVDTLEANAEGGMPTRLVVREGHIFHSKTEVPADWIASMSDKGIMLTRTRAEIEAMRSD